MSNEKYRAEAIVIVEWILLLLGILILSMLGLAFYDELLAICSSSDPKMRSTLLVDGLLILVGILISLSMNMLLMQGVRKDHSTACKTWYIMATIFLVMSFVASIADLVTLNIPAFFIKGAIIWYRIYAVLTIMAFTESLRRTARGDSDHNGLIFSPYDDQIDENISQYSLSEKS